MNIGITHELSCSGAASLTRRQWLTLTAVSATLGGCATPTGDAWQGSADLGVVIERASGRVSIVNTSRPQVLGQVDGLGDLSHASVVFSRDGRYAFVFGRDGAMSKVDILQRRLVGRVQQAGNSIGGAISADGRYVAAQNYTPGGVKVFDAETLALVADIPADDGTGRLSRVVGLVDLLGHRFACSLFDAGQIWVIDVSKPQQVRVQKFTEVGRQPYDALVTPNGRHYIAGLFGEDGLAVIDLWESTPRVRRILNGYGRGQQPLPVYKMPHLRGWAVAGRRAYLPAIGRHEVLIVDTESWQEVGRIPVAGQPVFVIARPDGRQVWVNFAVPDYDRVQVIDTQTQHIVKTLMPGKAVLHLEFTPRGESVWISSRDDNRVTVVDTESLQEVFRLTLESPSGIFFTSRVARMGF